MRRFLQGVIAGLALLCVPLAAPAQTISVPPAGCFATLSCLATSFVPSSSTIPTNGLYLPAANTVGWAVNSTQIATLSEGGGGVGATLKLVSANGAQVWLGAASAEGYLAKTGSLITLTGNRRIDVVTTLSGTTSPVINITTPNTSGAAADGGDITLTAGNGTGTGGSDGGNIVLRPGTSTNGVPGLVKMTGTTVVGDAAAGDIGEPKVIDVAAGSAVSLTSGAAANVGSVSLTAGDWWGCGGVYFDAAPTTTSTLIAAWISTTSATLPTAPNAGAYAEVDVSQGAGGDAQLATGCRRINVGSTTTVYLGAFSNHAVSTKTAYGYATFIRFR